MSGKYAAVIVVTSLAVVLGGCARGNRNLAPEAGQAVPSIAQPTYLPTAEAFLAALEHGRPDGAYELMTEPARKAITAEQFQSDLSDIGASGHRVVAQASTEDAAFIMVTFEHARSANEQSQGMPGIELLLLKVGESWQVAMFAPPSDNAEEIKKPALTKSGPHAWTVNWLAPDGAHQSITLTEVGE